MSTPGGTSSGSVEQKDHRRCYRGARARIVHIIRGAKAVDVADTRPRLRSSQTTASSTDLPGSTHGKLSDSPEQPQSHQLERRCKSQSLSEASGCHRHTSPSRQEQTQGTTSLDKLVLLVEDRPRSDPHQRRAEHGLCGASSQRSTQMVSVSDRAERDSSLCGDPSPCGKEYAVEYSRIFEILDSANPRTSTSPRITPPGVPQCRQFIQSTQAKAASQTLLEEGALSAQNFLSMHAPLGKMSCQAKASSQTAVHEEDAAAARKLTSTMSRTTIWTSTSADIVEAVEPKELRTMFASIEATSLAQSQRIPSRSTRCGSPQLSCHTDKQNTAVGLSSTQCTSQLFPNRSLEMEPPPILDSPMYRSSLPFPSSQVPNRTLTEDLSHPTSLRRSIRSRATFVNTTKLDMEKVLCATKGQALVDMDRHKGPRHEVDHQLLSLEALADSPISPTLTRSDAESVCDDYDTPLTTPGSSPVKTGLSFPKLPAIDFSPARYDGGEDSDEQIIDPVVVGALERQPDIRCSDVQDALEPSKDLVRDALLRSSFSANCTPSPRRHPRIDLTEADTGLQTQVESGLVAEDETPLTKACAAKGARAFPFPVQASYRSPASLLSAQRHPSMLLQHCERNATPRQRRITTCTLQSPDRFISGRRGSPTKDALLLHKPVSRHAGVAKRHRLDEEILDPFGPTPSRSARMADRFVTIRRLPSTHRSAGGTGTVVTDSLAANRRAVSAGAVWTVGGTVVTEGVASVTNGRGGRVTSGTSAPHYTADFLRRQSASEEEMQHGQRLAVAMDVDQNARMLKHSSPASATTPDASRRGSCSNIGRRGTFWKNSAWEKEIVTTPTKIPKQKSKEIPAIPFRVLDAPALRDDYYCSLLSYSQTMQCLAVGLGPHVYLWSEARGTTPTHIPDSLTAPFGAHVTSVSFSSEEGGSSILAIGRADGRITLWSPQDRDPRFDSEQPAPVSCVCFRPNAVKRQSVREPAATVLTEELLVGDEVGNVYLYSIEWPSQDQRDLFGWHGSMTLLARVSCHTQQVCGIAWSRDGEYIATGGNDNQLFLFETRKLFLRPRHDTPSQQSTINVRNGNTTEGQNVPGQGRVLAITPGKQKHLFALNAAVKAIAFAPWQSSLVAAGGGSNDRCIHFFHALSGATLATIDCHAQVTSLVWSETRKEIAATFGFAQPEHPYRVAVFAWPSCQRVVGIPWWSEERALYAVAYPGGPSGGPSKRRRGTSQGAQGRVDSETKPWYGRRTRDEGCLVIATSDASIKFHEVWAERSDSRRGGTSNGLLRGSLVLEDGVSSELERDATIR